MASIFLANLDADAIGLGASCTRPEVLARDQSSARKRITLEAEDDNNVGFTPAGPIQALTNGSAQVSVSDCLACSGCVTSAESVLLAEQAAPKLALLCNEGRPVDVVVDRASLASVAQKFDCTPAEALARLRAACTASTGGTAMLVRLIRGVLGIIVGRQKIRSRCACSRVRHRLCLNVAGRKQARGNFSFDHTNAPRCAAHPGGHRLAVRNSAARGGAAWPASAAVANIPRWRRGAHRGPRLQRPRRKIQRPRRKIQM